MTILKLKVKNVYYLRLWMLTIGGVRNLRMSENIPVFSSKEEETQYFKNVASEYKKKWQDSVQELGEFQESSRVLEIELEAQLEMQNKELRVMNMHLQMECDNLKEKLEVSHLEGHNQFISLEHELSTLKAEKEEFLKYVQELKQSNDDLEQGKRATVSSLEDFETKLNLTIERNAFLVSELDEKETLTGLLQLLKDKAQVVSPCGHTPLTPSARISALNIVGDLLRKIGKYSAH
ncbi:nuclear distribution protein nudE-like 1 isoform X2 [Tachypleus tridentatus]|uniref:nuclear distribution protein nudE-like 1 isoform X2 n=1 Tax=Tachypleus tridentatus TaxID=6853 RepID=UPI003FD1023F